MGCGASSKADQKNPNEVQAIGTWATKKQENDDSPVVRLSKKTGDDVVRERSPTAERMIVLDADDDEPNAEFLQEKTTPAAVNTSAANAQEAPEAMEISEAKQCPQQPELSQRQKEEAAKLAEQRKRFDNQRYQKECNLTAGGIGECPTQERSNGVEYPNHDLMMGLNLTRSKPDVAGQGVDTAFDCLPGGIAGDTPREDEVTNSRYVIKANRHDAFDDDDEVLMKEILESVDA